LALFTLLAVAANVVLVDVTLESNWTIPLAEVDAVGSRAVATVPLLRFEALRLDNPLPLPLNVPAVTVPGVVINVPSVSMLDGAINPSASL
jgi:hypothetical protein